MAIKSKIDQELIKVLACPDCQGRIELKKIKSQASDPQLQCVNCKRIFIFKDQVLEMLPKLK